MCIELIEADRVTDGRYRLDLFERVLRTDLDVNRRPNEPYYSNELYADLYDIEGEWLEIANIQRIRTFDFSQFEPEQFYLL